VPNTYILECDYADYLDEALNESYELREALEANETAEHKRKYFILKPSMTDRGQGIRLFSTTDELRDIFEDFETVEDSTSDDEDDDTGVIASQVRHFVVQDYISQPLLLKTMNAGKKFHIRAYVVAHGAIKVWVWSEMLALFAAETYASPSVVPGQMDRHLTNTCLQDGSTKDANVIRFWSLPLSEEIKQNVFDQICQITGEIFLAAAAGQQMHFQVCLIHLILIRHYQTHLKSLV
jgi:tubulin---tyrosine ligase